MIVERSGGAFGERSATAIDAGEISGETGRDGMLLSVFFWEQ